MRVVKRGKLPEERIYNATCHYCRSELEFAENEGRVTHDQRDGSFVTVKCPVCGRDVHSALQRRGV